VERVVADARKLKFGDPGPATDAGTLIDEGAARRVEVWIEQAVEAGAGHLTARKRHVAQVGPRVLADVSHSMRVICDEVFGPVVGLVAYDDIDDGFRAVGASRFGLQTGILTRPMETAMRAARSIRSGGIIINGTSTWRTDQLAYGVSRTPGSAAMAPRFSIRGMTEERIALFNL
jgi:acyl-CoA reductase-like NAD-dependent aldehyde dehydrogenase